MTEGSPLYARTMTRAANDPDGGALMRQVWEGTPWIVDAYTGIHDDPRERLMLDWCHESFGDEALPFGRSPRAGRWRRGNATVFGWTWFGFAAEADALSFMARWPAPPEVPELSNGIKALEGE